MATVEEIQVKEPAARVAEVAQHACLSPLNGESAGLRNENGSSAADLDDIHGEKMVLNMGPSHPSTHGVLRIVLEMDGEIITKAVPDVG